MMVELQTYSGDININPHHLGLPLRCVAPGLMISKLHEHFFLFLFQTREPRSFPTPTPVKNFLTT